jgi:hypothetical protein
MKKLLTIFLLGASLTIVARADSVADFIET